jgi:hypothetical protein
MEDRRCERLEHGRSQGWSEAVSETGAYCAEAQADGVPCETLGVSCDTCDRAVFLTYDRTTRSGVAAGR